MRGVVSGGPRRRHRLLRSGCGGPGQPEGWAGRRRPAHLRAVLGLPVL